MSVRAQLRLKASFSLPWFSELLKPHIFLSPVWLMYQETDAEQLRVFLPSQGFAQPCINTPLSTQYVAAHPGRLLSSCPQEHDFFYLCCSLSRSHHAAWVQSPRWVFPWVNDSSGNKIQELCWILPQQFPLD